MIGADADGVHQKQYITQGDIILIAGLDEFSFKNSVDSDQLALADQYLHFFFISSKNPQNEGISGYFAHIFFT